MALAGEPGIFAIRPQTCGRSPFPVQLKLNWITGAEGATPPGIAQAKGPQVHVSTLESG